MGCVAMDFAFNVATCVGAPSGHVGPYVGYIDEGLMRGSRSSQLCTVLDAVGKASAVAQGLRKPVTLGTQYLLGQRIYLLADSRRALGLLKVGTKRLFVVAPTARGSEGSTVQDTFQEINPLCALDFYVHESCQRSGFGRLIVDAMLSKERLRPEQLAFDRPSPKFLAFLQKHFGLAHFRQQSNNFVVFDEYFEGDDAGRARAPCGTLGRREANGYFTDDGQTGCGGILPLGMARPQDGPRTGAVAPAPTPGRTAGLDLGENALDRGLPGSSGWQPIQLHQRMPPQLPPPAPGTVPRRGGAAVVQAPWATESAPGAPSTVPEWRPPWGTLAPPDGLAAGLPSRGATVRSQSLPSGRSRQASGAGSDSFGGLWGPQDGGRSGSGGSGGSRRFASPFADAGQRVLQR